MQSFRIIKSSKHLFLICLLLDIFFIIAAAFSIGMFYPKMIDELVTLTEFVGTAQPTLEQLQAVQANQELFQQAYNNVVRYFFFMVFGIYLSYSALQGIAWKIALKKIKKKLTLITYLRRFFALNIFWSILFLLFGALYVQLSFTNAAILGKGPTALNIVFTLLSMFFFYFLLISYSQAFKAGIFKNLKTLIKRGTELFKKAYRAYAAILFILVFCIFFIDYVNGFAVIGVLLISIILLEFLRWEFAVKTSQG